MVLVLIIGSSGYNGYSADNGSSSQDSGGYIGSSACNITAVVLVVRVHQTTSVVEPLTEGSRAQEENDEMDGDRMKG